jgi:hypothetical protein
MHRNSASVSTKQERIATLAKQSPQMAFTSLAYLLDLEWLKEAYQRNGAITAADALAIINHINAGFGGPLTAATTAPAEGESAANPTLDELALLFATDAEQGPATRRKS